MNVNNFWCTESWGNLTSEYYKLVHLASIMLPHYLVKDNSSDAACLESTAHTTHQLALVRATHLLLGKTILTSVN